MKNGVKKFTKTLLKLDMFGKPVGFSIDGGGTRKSCIGLLLSLLIIATLIPYSFKKLERLIEYEGVWVSLETDPEGK